MSAPPTFNTQFCAAGTEFQHAAGNRGAAGVGVHAGENRQLAPDLLTPMPLPPKTGVHPAAANVVGGVARQRARARQRAAADLKRPDRGGKPADLQRAAVDRVGTGLMTAGEVGPVGPVG